MSEFNPDQPPIHDNIDEVEFAKLKAENEISLEAKYEADVAVFRANVLLEMMCRGAYTDGSGWAIYVCGGSELSGSVIEEDGAREILITVSNRKSQNNCDSVNLRIIVNQRFQPEVEKIFYLTEDCMVDADNDAQYYMSAADVADEKIQVAPGFTPIFMVKEGELLIGGLEPFPVVNRVHNVPGDPRMGVVMPFGHYTNLEDSIYALDKAKSLFEEATSGVLVEYKKHDATNE